jgi:hypothetical protein
MESDGLEVHCGLRSSITQHGHLLWERHGRELVEDYEEATLPSLSHNRNVPEVLLATK